MASLSSWHPPGKTSSLNPAYGAQFRAWFEKPVGKRFLEMECQKINAIIPTLFGYDAVLIGEPNFSVCMQNSTIKHQYIVNDDLALIPKDTEGFIHSRLDRLPIGSSLIDVVYLAHSLEFSANPHEVLREAQRILRADGHLLVSMFNPFSFWGAWRDIAKYGKNILWKSNFMSIVKLKDWLALLGFDIIRVNYFAFNLPLNKTNYSHNLSMLERYGQKYELPFGSAYIIEASKRVIPLTPVTSTWTAVQELDEDVIEPTA